MVCVLWLNNSNRTSSASLSVYVRETLWSRELKNQNFVYFVLPLNLIITRPRGSLTMSLAVSNPRNGAIINGHKHKSKIQLNAKEMEQTISVVIRSNLSISEKKKNRRRKNKNEKNETNKKNAKLKRNNNKILF